MSIVNIMEQLKEIRERLASQQEPLKQEFCNMLIPMMKEVGVSQIVVQAYTPYFNDGDVCEYGIENVLFLKSLDVRDLDNIWDYFYDNEYSIHGKIVEPIENVFSENVQLFKALFGEGQFIFRVDGTFEEDEEFEHE